MWNGWGLKAVARTVFISGQRETTLSTQSLLSEETSAKGDCLRKANADSLSINCLTGMESVGGFLVALRPVSYLNNIWPLEMQYVTFHAAYLPDDSRCLQQLAEHSSGEPFPCVLESLSFLMTSLHLLYFNIFQRCSRKENLIPWWRYSQNEGNAVSWHHHMVLFLTLH